MSRDLSGLSCHLPMDTCYNLLHRFSQNIMRSIETFVRVPVSSGFKIPGFIHMGPWHKVRSSTNGCREQAQPLRGGPKYFSRHLLATFFQEVRYTAVFLETCQGGGSLYGRPVYVSTFIHSSRQAFLFWCQKRNTLCLTSVYEVCEHRGKRL